MEWSGEGAHSTPLHPLRALLVDLRTGGCTSIRAERTAYGIPESTLRARLDGTPNRRTAHHHRKKLSVLQEKFLVDWTLEQESQGFPPSHARTREMVTQIIRMNDDTKELGKRFIPKLIRDNPRITSVMGRPIEQARINGTNPEAVQEFYALYEHIVREFNIRFLCDELGELLVNYLVYIVPLLESMAWKEKPKSHDPDALLWADADGEPW
jgi:hypothetical protein